jgi:hypothetical protein
MSAPTKLEVIHAYRHLYRGLLQAVLFSKPARYTARDTLRDAFRTDPPHMYNQKRIDKTVEFLQYAAKETGLEHKILRNLLLMKYSQKSQRPFRRRLVACGPVTICVLIRQQSSKSTRSTFNYFKT